MFCIAAFIVLAILSIFSASHRKLAKSAWHCVVRKASFRPCDSSFKQDLKATLLAKVMIKQPRLAKHLDRLLEILAVIFIALTFWSLYVAVKSGLNLFVYGTCSPRNASACSLSSEACSIESSRPSFYTSLKTGKPHQWLGTELTDFADTVMAIPTRLQKWDATKYVPESATYYRPFDATKPTALEIVDPGCQFCAQLFMNIKEAEFYERYNLTYIVHPIRDAKDSTKYKFAGSYVVASYIEAIRLTPLEGAEVPVDWRFLQRIYSEHNKDNYSYQLVINTLNTQDQTKAMLRAWLKEFGYSPAQVTKISKAAESDQVRQILDANERLVKDTIKTVKIPTIIYDGRRHDGVVPVEDLR